MRAVSKFGGSSLADRACIQRVAALVKTPSATHGRVVSRQHIVVSAPGKRDSQDRKVTDLLLDAHSFAAVKDRPQYDAALEAIATRFEGLSSLRLGPALEQSAAAIWEHASRSSSSAFAVSRGEYLNGLVMAHETGYEFVDPADGVIIFDENHM